MAAIDRRVELDALLRETIGNNNVYFQPPENLQIRYPCVVYDLSGFKEVHANNKVYNRGGVYDIKYITRDPEDENIEKLADLFATSMGRPYTADGLHHYPYTIHY